MRLIRKDKEPRSLVEYRKIEGATYDGLPSDTKIELRTALIGEQGGLCCYCMRRIRDDEEKERKQQENEKDNQVRIEHWKPQSRHRDLALSWTNLFAACNGNEGKDHSDQHCDVRKHDDEITLNPTNPRHIASLSYGTSGQLQSEDATVQRDLDQSLNLNHVTLQRNRKDAVRGMIESLHRLAQKRTASKIGAFSDALLRAELARCSDFDAQNRLPPFAGALAYWLEKRLGTKSSP
jgi:uncharacterized protein (TIGR02646 family)